MKRYKANKNKDRKIFSATAAHVNGRNMSSNPMRGGYRF